MAYTSLVFLNFGFESYRKQASSPSTGFYDKRIIPETNTKFKRCITCFFVFLPKDKGNKSLFYQPIPFY